MVYGLISIFQAHAAWEATQYLSSIPVLHELPVERRLVFQSVHQSGLRGLKVRHFPRDVGVVDSLWAWSELCGPGIICIRWAWWIFRCCHHGNWGRRGCRDTVCRIASW